MGLADRLHHLLTNSADDPEHVVEGPAAAGSSVSERRPVAADPASSGEVSSGGSGTDGTETSAGGADGVPDTPDGVAANFT